MGYKRVERPAFPDCRTRCQQTGILLWRTKCKNIILHFTQRERDNYRKRRGIYTRHIVLCIHRARQSTRQALGARLGLSRASLGLSRHSRSPERPERPRPPSPAHWPRDVHISSRLYREALQLVGQVYSMYLCLIPAFQIFLSGHFRSPTDILVP